MSIAESASRARYYACTLNGCVCSRTLITCRDAKISAACGRAIELRLRGQRILATTHGKTKPQRFKQSDVQPEPSRNLSLKEKPVPSWISTGQATAPCTLTSTMSNVASPRVFFALPAVMSSSVTELATCGISSRTKILARTCACWLASSGQHHTTAQGKESLFAASGGSASVDLEGANASEA